MIFPFSRLDWIRVGVRWCIILWVLTLPTSLTKGIRLKLGGEFWIPLLVVTLVTINLVGLIPYILSIRNLPIISFFRAILIWLSIVSLWSYLFSKKWLNLRFSRYLPIGRPVWLWWILPWIELVSRQIRPFTLILRITVNLISGHLLLTLTRILRFLVGQVGIMILLLFELIVCVIQGRIFVLLLTLYKEEFIKT